MRFDEALKYMMENPNSEIQSPSGYFVRWGIDDCFQYRYCNGNQVDYRNYSFCRADIDCEWTIPRPELETVEVVAFKNDIGGVHFVIPGSDTFYNVVDCGYTQVKVKQVKVKFEGEL